MTAFLLFLIGYAVGVGVKMIIVIVILTVIVIGNLIIVGYLGVAVGVKLLLWIPAPGLL